MKLKLTIEAEYEIPDDLEVRQRLYGTTDPEECAKYDEEHVSWAELLDASQVLTHRVEYELEAS